MWYSLLTKHCNLKADWCYCRKVCLPPNFNSFTKPVFSISGHNLLCGECSGLSTRFFGLVPGHPPQRFAQVWQTLKLYSWQCMLTCIREELLISLSLPFGEWLNKSFFCTKIIYHSRQINNANKQNLARANDMNLMYLLFLYQLFNLLL